jgi:nitroreductase
MSVAASPSPPRIDLYEAMRTCRAVRRHRPDPIPDEVLRRVLEAATWAPSGGNAQPWRIVVVRDAAKRRALRDLYVPHWEAYQAEYRKASAGATGELADQRDRMLAAADHLARHLERSPVIVVFCFDPRRMAITDEGLGRPSVVGGASVYPAVQNLLLACRAEGLGGVLTTLLCRAEPEVRRLLEIPEPWATCAFVPIGWPERRGHGPLRRRPVEGMAFADRFGERLARMESAELREH